jgi:hypothetical protein
MDIVISSLLKEAKKIGVSKTTLDGVFKKAEGKGGVCH